VHPFLTHCLLSISQKALNDWYEEVKKGELSARMKDSHAVVRNKGAELRRSIAAAAVAAVGGATPAPAQAQAAAVGGAAAEPHPQAVAAVEEAAAATGQEAAHPQAVAEEAAAAVEEAAAAAGQEAAHPQAVAEEAAAAVEEAAAVPLVPQDL